MNSEFEAVKLGEVLHEDPLELSVLGIQLREAACLASHLTARSVSVPLGSHAVRLAHPLQLRWR